MAYPRGLSSKSWCSHDYEEIVTDVVTRVGDRKKSLTEQCWRALRTRETTPESELMPKRVDTHNMNSVVEALTAVMDVAALSSIGKQTLAALVQSVQSSDDDHGELSALATLTYQSRSYYIVDVLLGLPDKAQAELDGTRHAETTAAHNFAMRRQPMLQRPRKV